MVVSRESALLWYGYAEELGVGWFDCTPLWSGLPGRTCALGLVGCVALGHRAENSHTP